MVDFRQLPPDLRSVFHDMLVDPAAVDLTGDALRQGATVLNPGELEGLLVWQFCARPGRSTRSLLAQGRRLKAGREYRRAVLPVTRKVRHVDFGDGLGLRFTADHPAARPFMERVIPANGVHELELVRYLKRTVRAGDLVIDVGSHVGYVACIAAALGATVIAVEMQPTLIPIIQLNAVLNDLWSVHPLCAALGDRTGLVPTMRTEPSPGYQGNVAHWERGDYQLGSVNHDCVPRLTLDSLLAGTPSPAIVKVDVEGAEGLVLAGARRLIEACETSFVIEVHARLIDRFGTKLEDILAAFDETRWSLSMLTTAGTTAIDRDVFRDPSGPVAAHVHNAPVLFEPRRT